MNKNRHIIGELQEFFANNDSSKAINSISTIMNSIRIQGKDRVGQESELQIHLSSGAAATCPVPVLFNQECRLLFVFCPGQDVCLPQGYVLSFHERRQRQLARYNLLDFQEAVFTCETQNSIELSVVERIWLLIVEVINVIAEVLNCDTLLLTEQVIASNKQIKAVNLAFDRLTPVA